MLCVNRAVKAATKVLVGELPYQADEAYAASLDDRDALAAFRAEFNLPPSPAHRDGRASLYLCGNSLGLQPKAAREAVLEELDDWARLGVEAHHHGKFPWLNYHELMRETGARLVGAEPGEVVLMNSLTVNLHLMMASFYRPTDARHKIIIEDDAFPSDSYAVESHARWHGQNPVESIVRLKPREGEDCLRTEDILSAIERHGPSVALVMLGGVNYLSGEWFDMPTITEAGHRAGAMVGWDLAHAAGNVPMHLHAWNVDFAAWCSYKYLNSGPGAVSGVFVHDSHGRDTSLNRLAGWWGNDPATRFEMRPGFTPKAGADGWQLSNPPILSLAPVRVSLDVFDRATMPAIRAKSLRLTGYLEFLLDRITNGGGRRLIEVITPREPERRGCQLSIAVADRPKRLHEELKKEGVICDFREPNVIRVAPTPLYNTFHEVWRFAQIVERVLKTH